jgi:hypothetical protein
MFATREAIFGAWFRFLNKANSWIQQCLQQRLVETSRGALARATKKVLSDRHF